MSDPITILLADDHAMFRDALRHALDAEPDMKVLAGVGNSDDAVAEAGRLEPDIILMDIDMPGMVCFDAAKRIQPLSPRSRLVFLSAFFNDRYIEQAIAVRAWAYVVKTEPEATLAEVIRKVHAGETYFSPQVQARLVVDGGVPSLTRQPVCRVSALTDREMEVLRCIARGLTEKEIGQIMHISPHTVHRHTTSVKHKLDIHNRVELARYAIREGLAEA